MRQNHIAGEKVFIDYCGPTVPVVDVHTGTFIGAQIIVAVLGASNYTFACASASQKEANWIDAHTKAAVFFGGWATLTIPDNLKSGVTKTDRYNRPFKKLPSCRRSLFEQIEQAKFIPLPSQSYEYQHVRRARAHVDYHIECDKHYYSVPHMLVGAQVKCVPVIA
jgi:transposase